MTASSHSVGWLIHTAGTSGSAVRNCAQPDAVALVATHLPKLIHALEVQPHLVVILSPTSGVVVHPPQWI
jgi:hypothetical protein